MKDSYIAAELWAARWIVDARSSSLTGSTVEAAEDTRPDMEGIGRAQRGMMSRTLALVLNEPGPRDVVRAGGGRRSRNPQAAQNCAEGEMHILVVSSQRWARHHACLGWSLCRASHVRHSGLVQERRRCVLESLPISPTCQSWKGTVNNAKKINVSNAV